MEFKMKEVGSRDYKNVMDFSGNVNGGFDYLPDIYHDVIRHPSYQGYASVLNGKFVSVIVTY